MSRISYMSSHYTKIVEYLKNNKRNTVDDIKNRSKKFNLIDEGLFVKDSNIRVIYELDLLEKVVESIHKDLDHYGKDTTMSTLKIRYIVAKDVIEKGLEVLDSCVPCQLYKKESRLSGTAKIHPYGVKKPFEFWEMDFVGPLILTPHGKAYVITAVDYATSKAVAYSLESCSA